MAALVYVLVGGGPGRGFLVDELDLLDEGRQRVPARARGAGQPARADVALAVDEELRVERGGLTGRLAEAPAEQRVGRRDVGRAVGDHRVEDRRPAAQAADDVAPVVPWH